MIYVMMEYDTYFQDVRRTFTIDCENESEAISRCKRHLCQFHPSDCIEIQLYVDGLSRGELCMIGCAYYDDSPDCFGNMDITYEECYS